MGSGVSTVGAAAPGGRVAAPVAAAGWHLFLAFLGGALAVAVQLAQVQLAGPLAGAPAVVAEVAGVAGESAVVTPSVYERYRPPGRGQVAAVDGAVLALGAVWGGSAAAAARA